MTFVDPVYPAFLLVVWVLYWSLPHRWQNNLLVVVSLVFYGWVRPWYVVLMVLSATIDWYCALRIHDDPKNARRWLTLSIACGAAILGTFKYFDFFVENVHAALSLFGLSPGLPVLGLALPAGISFYTFQTMAYAIDVYRKQAEPRRSYRDYLVFVTFFPQLVAGPIERATALLTQVERPRELTLLAMRTGVSLVLWGTVKKMVVADTLSPYVDFVFHRPNPSHALLWSGAFGFLVQVLADFSAYTDIARGSAQMLGFELMENFRHPLLARNPPELWERWHISFSTWLRDYIYFPASRSALLRRWLRFPGMQETGLTYQIRATLVTMTFSGLWHGAAWHFVLWGMFWGTVQVLWLVFERRFGRFVRKIRHSYLNIVWMAPLHLASNLLFRDPSVAHLVQGLTSNPFRVSPEHLGIAAGTVAVTLSTGSVLVAALVFETQLLPRLRPTAAWPMVETTLWSAAVLTIAVFARDASEQFVYFAF